MRGFVDGKTVRFRIEVHTIATMSDHQALQRSWFVYVQKNRK